MPFISLLRKRVVLSGPSISCEISPHLQTFFVATRARVAKKFMSAHWQRPSRTESDFKKIVLRSEVGLSTAITEAGYKFASLQPSRKNFEVSDCLHACPENPTKYAQDPFALIFVKYGVIV